MGPILYRYIDWSITVPLQMIEFFLILKAVTPSTSSSMFFRLFLGTVWMLASGYAGEAHFMPAQTGFVSGLAGWGFILYEIFAGEAGQDASKANKAVGEAFTIMHQQLHVLSPVPRHRVDACVRLRGRGALHAGYFFGYLC